MFISRAKFSFFAYIAKRFFGFQYLHVANIEVKILLHSDIKCLSLNEPLKKTIESKSYFPKFLGCEKFSPTEAVIEQFDFCDIHTCKLNGWPVVSAKQINDFTIQKPSYCYHIKAPGLSTPQSIKSDFKFQKIRIKATETNFPIIIASTIKIDFDPINESIEGIFHSEIKANIIYRKYISPTFNNLLVSPFPFNILPAQGDDLLALFHNNLLDRINKGLIFIGEMDNGTENFQKLSEEISLLVKKYGSREATRLIWKRFPGAAASYLVFSAVYEYSHGEFWHFSLNSIYIPSNPVYQRFWGLNFLLFINFFHLNPFIDTGLKYVGPILGHAMIPNDCLPELFGQLLEPAIRSPIWTGRIANELISMWLSHSTSFAGVDKPVWHFFQYGGTIAENFVTEAMKMVQIRFETGQVPQANELKLPERTVHNYKKWLEQQFNPPAPRSPFLRLDPSSGIQLAFPTQKFLQSQDSIICSWIVFAAGQRYRAPQGYAQRDSEFLVFNANDIPIPPDGPYNIQFEVDRNTIGEWCLEGMTDHCWWKLFSGTTYKEIDSARPLHPESTWIVIPENGVLSIYDSQNIELSDVVKQRCDLIEDWMGFLAFEVDLSAATTVKIELGEKDFFIPVAQSDVEIKLIDGDLLQSIENSLEDIALYGENPPKIVLRTKLGEEDDFVDSVKLRISGQGIDGFYSIDFNLNERATGIQREVGYILIALDRIIPSKLSPGKLAITIWHQNNRLADYKFVWMPGLSWQWSKDGRNVRLCPPKGADLSVLKTEDELSQCDFSKNNYPIPLPEGGNELDIKFVWKKSDHTTFEFPLRLHGPRWAYLNKASDPPLWRVDPIEVSPEKIFDSEASCLLFEMKDINFAQIELQARWALKDDKSSIVDLKIEALPKKDRWLVRLVTLFDTLRNFSKDDSEVIIQEKTLDADSSIAFKVSILDIITPVTFRWAIQYKQIDPTVAMDWITVCEDLNIGKLIQRESPHIIFEVKKGKGIKTAIGAFWRPIGHFDQGKKLSTSPTALKGRWKIDLFHLLKWLETSSKKNSEIYVKVNDPDSTEGEIIQIDLFKIFQKPVSLKTYEDCCRWAEGNRLHKLGLDLLCDLHYKYWFSVEDLAHNWETTIDFVLQAIKAVKIECPDISINELIKNKQKIIAIGRNTYKSMYDILDKWNRKQMWME